MSGEGGDADADETGAGLATVAGGAVRVFGGRVGKLLLVFLAQLVMARVLGSDGYGGVVIAQMAIGVGSVVGALGLDSGLARKVPLHETDPERLRGVVRGGLVVGLLSGALVGAGAFLAAPVFATELFGDPDVTVLLQLAAVGVPFGVLSYIGGAVARGAGSTAVRVGVRQLLNPVLNLLLVVAFLLAGYGAAGAAAGVVGAIVIGSLVALFLALRALPVSLRGPSVPMSRELFVFSLPLLMTSSVEFVLVHTDTFLIGVFRGPSAVGIYNAAFKIRQFGMVFFYPATFLLPTVLTRFDSEDRTQAAARIYQVTTKWLVLLSGPVVLVLLLFPEVVLGLTFGPDYLGARTALQVLLVSVMVTVLLSANGSALVALGHNRINAVVNAGTAVTNVGLNLLLIPRFGILGAAVATSTAFVARDVAYSVALYRREGLQPFSGAMARPFLLAVVVAVGGQFLVGQFGRPTLLSVLGVGAVYLVVYVPGAVALGALEPEDERLLDRIEERGGVDLAPLRQRLERLRRFG
jgi:O-antigen/teichoic acid export membrane protein